MKGNLSRVQDQFAFGKIVSLIEKVLIMVNHIYVGACARMRVFVCE